MNGKARNVKFNDLSLGDHKGYDYTTWGGDWTYFLKNI